ncbi:MAG: MFS transporter [Candidatus Heimdallarchaeaceae archaeon]
MTFAEKFKEAQNGKRFSYLFTIIIGLGFFTTAITWAIYNIYIPTYIEDYLEAIWGELAFATTLIGFIMVLDNIAAVLLQPWIGNVSDNTWKRYGKKKKGRRMPFVVIGLPIGAVFFILLGVFGFDIFSNFESSLMLGFILLLVTIGGFNISMALFRSPVVSLMPDLVPKEYRSRGNGIINLLGGVGALIGLFVFPMIEKVNTIVAFIIIGVILILCLVALYFSIKEPEELTDVAKSEPVKILPALKEIFARKDKSMIFILFAVFSWFFGFNVVETYFSLYGVNVLLMEKADASLILGILALTFILFAFPAGLIAKKIGRKQTILIGLGLIVVSLGTASIFSLVSIPALEARTTFIGMDIPYVALLDAGCFFFTGIGWAFVNINSIVIVWELAGEDKIGMGTGIYYFFSAAAAITGPLIIGGILDLLNLGLDLESGEKYKFLFIFATLFFLIASILILFVKKTGVEGESGDLPPEGKPEKVEPLAE